MKKRLCTRKKEALTGLFFVFPAVLVLVFVFLIPLIEVVRISFTDLNMITGSMDPVGFSNYRYLLAGAGSAPFFAALKHTALFALAHALLCIPLSLGLAAILTHRFPGRALLHVSFTAPSIIPLAAGAVIWLFLLDPYAGPLNALLTSLDIPALSWLYDERTALLCVLLFSLWRSIGFFLLLFTAALNAIPSDCLEAARLDGATASQLFFRIRLPFLRPVLALALVIDLIEAVKSFSEFHILVPDGGPLHSASMLVPHIYELAFTGGRLGRACAAAVLLFILLLAVSLIRHRLLKGAGFLFDKEGSHA